MGMIISERLIQAFNWMLIHSLWQGLLAALIAAFLLMLTRKINASVRYNLVLVLFSLLPLASIGTLIYEWDKLSAQTYQLSDTQSADSEGPGLDRIFPGIVPLESKTEEKLMVSLLSGNWGHINKVVNYTVNYSSEHSFQMVMIWFAFFAIRFLSIAGNMLYLQRARHYKVYIPSDFWKEKVDTLSIKLRIEKTVLLLESGYLKVPVVLGYLKPVILIPAGLLAGIPPSQLEAVLLHELAHIKRNDYAVNLVQNLMEAIFFFNPGLLWISRTLREERENCCDDIAIKHINNKYEFVQALISFKEYSNSLRNYAIAFAGEKHSLLNRVLRIVYQENKPFSKSEKGFFAATIIMLSVTVFALAQIRSSERVTNRRIFSVSKNLSAGINAQNNDPAGDANISGEQGKLTTSTLMQTANIFPGEGATPEKIVNLMVGRRKKWSDVEDTTQQVWNSRWAAITEKYNLLWPGHTEDQQLRSRLAANTTAQSAQENNAGLLPQTELLAEQEKSELYRQRYNLATHAWNKAEKEEKNIHKQRDELLVEWGIYLKSNPHVNSRYYWNIIGLNSQYDIKAAGMNQYYNKSYGLMARYLKENPGKAISLDRELANLRTEYFQKRGELNAIYVGNPMNREVNGEYFREFFAHYAAAFKKLSKLKSWIKMDDLNEGYIRRITAVDLEIFLKKGEINERINQRNNEIIAENYRRKLIQVGIAALTDQSLLEKTWTSNTSELEK